MCNLEKVINLSVALFTGSYSRSFQFWRTGLGSLVLEFTGCTPPVPQHGYYTLQVGEVHITIILVKSTKFTGLFLIFLQKRDVPNIE